MIYLILTTKTFFLLKMISFDPLFTIKHTKLSLLKIFINKRMYVDIAITHTFYTILLMDKQGTGLTYILLVDKQGTGLPYIFIYEIVNVKLDCHVYDLIV